MEDAMKGERTGSWSRRDLVRGLAVAGTAGLLGLYPEPAATEPPPETPKLRLAYFPDTICTAPMDVAADLLKREGFVDVQYVKVAATLGEALTLGKADMGLDGAASLVGLADAGAPVVVLAGVHVGCF